MGYHTKEIVKGNYGDFSKIEEEFSELEDAVNQKCKLLVLNELADMIGAIEGYLQKHYNTVSLEDLIHMSDLTKSAFKDGTR